jgi:hypothetical protein
MGTRLLVAMLALSGELCACIEAQRATPRLPDAGPGAAEIFLCRYSATSGAFDGWQRARADAQTVKFQEGKYLVLVKSKDTPNANLVLLMRALEASLSKN